MRAFIPNECICPFTSLFDALNQFSKEIKETKTEKKEKMNEKNKKEQYKSKLER